MSIMGLTAVGTAFAMIVASTQARGRSPADAQQRRCAQDLSISCFWRALAVACTLAAAAGGFPTACLGRDDAEPGRHNSARCETENPADLDIQSEHGKCKPQLAGNWWPQFRSTSVRDGVYVGVSSITESDAQDLTPIWKAPTGGPIFSSPSVATVANGIAYVGSLKGTLNAFNAATGALLWTNLAPSGPDELMSSPAVANGVVYIGGGDARVHAFNATTGAPVWTTLTGGPIISSPTVVNGVVYVGSDDKSVYAFDAGTGALVWSFAMSGMVRSSPAVANGVVYAASQNGTVYALRAGTGRSFGRGPSAPEF